MDELNSQAFQVRTLAGILSKLASQDLEHRLEASGVNASVLQYGVLRRISCCCATISELSAAMMLAPATLVPVVDALEHKGLIRRGQNVQDRRRKELTLTPAGNEVLEQLQLLTDDDDMVGRGLAQMGNEKSRRLLILLHELVTTVAPQPDAIDRVLAPATGVRQS
jgi:DNA-binding MarR family transcriptional regulator